MKINILLHFAFRDIESSFDPVKCIGLDSRPRNETSDAIGTCTDIPGSDLTPHPTERCAYFQLSFRDGFLCCISYFGTLTRDPGSNSISCIGLDLSQAL